MDQGTVYVVDDDEGVLKATARLIRAVGLQVETFPNVQAFLARRPRAGACCLVLDIRLPRITGLDLQATLEQTKEPMPIIFITGYGDVPTTVRAMKHGAIDLLQKPFQDSELLDAIERGLDRSRRELLDRGLRAAVEERFRTLTPREREVFGLVVTGMLNKQIAAELGTAEKTVKVHRGRVMEKMRVGSVADLVRAAERLGLPPSHPKPVAEARAS